jgi:hypothetical protein
MTLTRPGRYRDSALAAPNRIKVRPNVKRRGSVRGKSCDWKRGQYRRRVSAGRVLCRRHRDCSDAGHSSPNSAADGPRRGHPCLSLRRGEAQNLALPPFGDSRVDAGKGKLGLPSVSLESEETELSKTRYQQGSVRRVARQQGPDVWIFRWRNTHADGSRKENNRVIGTVLEYRTKAAAVCLIHWHGGGRRRRMLLPEIGSSPARG